MRLFLDDKRDAPPGWIQVRWPEDAMVFLKTGMVSALSLDHDLGNDHRGTGKDVVDFLEREVLRGAIPLPLEFHVHSDNAAGRKSILMIWKRLNELVGKGSIPNPPVPLLTAETMHDVIVRHFESDRVSERVDLRTDLSLHLYEHTTPTFYEYQLVVPELSARVDVRNALGLLFSRMHDEGFRYSLVVPDYLEYRRAILSVMPWVLGRFYLSVFAVAESGRLHQIGEERT